jgi:8-oxo-dGTP diphosphatase
VIPPADTERASRRYPIRPVLGVGAIIFAQDRVLLAERGRTPLKGQWSLPGGAVETGELLEAALRREVLEETGLGNVRFFEIYERIMRDAHERTEYHYVLIDYVCEAAGEARAADDVSKTAWVSMTELASYEITEGTAAVIERAFRAK